MKDSRFDLAIGATTAKVLFKYLLGITTNPSPNINYCYNFFKISAIGHVFVMYLQSKIIYKI